MARAAARKQRALAEGLAGRIGTELIGVGLIGAAALAGLAIATYSPSDPLFEIAPVANRAGAVGATIAGGLFRLFGYGGFVFVAGMAWLGGVLLLGRGVPGLTSRFWAGTGLLLISVASLPSLVAEVAPHAVAGLHMGWLGASLIGVEVMLLSVWGALLVNGFLLLLGLLSITGISPGTALRAVGSAGVLVGGVALAGLRIASQAIGRGVQAVAGTVGDGLTVVRARLADFEGSARARLGWTGRVRPAARRSKKRQLPEARDLFKGTAAEVSPGSETAAGEAEEEVEEEYEYEYEDGEEGEDWEWEEEEEETPPGSAHKPGEEPDIVDHVVERANERKPSQETFEFRDGRDEAGPFELPDSSLFQTPPDDSHTFDRESLLMNSRILEKKLADFGVQGKVVRVHPGPVVTMYEYEPGAGIKVNKIVNLSDDLALAMRALGIRIIAPLPGKSVVGIEVPNPEREIVYFRTLLESESMRGSEAKIGVAMGKDIFGNCVSADLAKMPHLLVAGATGTGKSVFLNSILCSMLCRMRPDELKLLLVDPKLLELSIYEGVPHLIADVVTNPKRAAAALAGIVRMMEERYLMMSALGVRNIDQFNDRVDAAFERGEESFALKTLPGESEGREVQYMRLPYIVVVIDELADLMVQVAREVEESLQRLAQMARAAGIHLILATQRPSVDVLTGVIKANFPSRVSFQVSSRIDSRTVLDQGGAEHLLGQGDMLFLPPGTSRLQRLHGSFISEVEVADLVSYLRKQGEPEFDEQLVRYAIESEQKEAAEIAGEDVDEMFDQAVAIVAETRNASISYVQRRLKIGYNRAARIIEAMEREGMIGPQIGAKGREVFMRELDEEEI